MNSSYYSTWNHFIFRSPRPTKLKTAICSRFFPSSSSLTRSSHFQGIFPAITVKCSVYDARGKQIFSYSLINKWNINWKSRRIRLWWEMISRSSWAQSSVWNRLKVRKSFSRTLVKYFIPNSQVINDMWHSMPEREIISYIAKQKQMRINIDYTSHKHSQRVGVGCRCCCK